MRDLVPSFDIIEDLLAENWELRWKVFKTLQQTRLILQDFARSSREHQQAQALCREMAGRLNGPSDVNLHLVLTAAWFLGGSHFLLLALEKIGVADPETGNPEIIRVRKPLLGNYSETSFFDYFHSLLSRNQAVDAGLATAIRIFPPEQTLKLLLSIPDPEIQAAALSQFKKHFPETFFNELLFKDDFAGLREKPELIDFIGPPLEPEIKNEIDNFVAQLLTSGDTPPESAVWAAGRLQLCGCKSTLLTLLDVHPAAAGALARLKDQNGCRKLLQAGKSWRRKKREAALPDLAWCPTPEAIALLQKRALQGNLKERQQAVKALGQIRTNESLQVLFALLPKCKKDEDLKLIFSALAGSKWPGETHMLANSLSQWSDRVELYPQILHALAALDYSDKWAKILQETKSPVLEPQHQEIALFMCRYADRHDIRRKLVSLIQDIDWGFSYRLLHLLAHQFKNSDITFLLDLLEERNQKRELTIQERLTKGSDLEKIDDALAEFLERHPEIINLVTQKIISRVITAKIPTFQELNCDLQQQPEELIKLMLSSNQANTAKQEADPRNFPLFLTMHLLAEIEVDGSDCFALVIHRTRRYSGFFREGIVSIINRLLDTEGELDHNASLALLNQIIDAIRGQPHFSTLRKRILKRISRITRNSRELMVFNEASQTRELRIYKVRKITV